MSDAKLITYVIRKDGKVIEYAHTLMCVNKSNPFVRLICPVPITNPDTLIHNDNCYIRTYRNYKEQNGIVNYEVSEVKTK